MISVAALDILVDENLRVDGRRPNELRKITCKFGAVPAAKGSVLLTQGNTVVLSSVYGPHELKSRSNRYMRQSHDQKLTINCHYGNILAKSSSTSDHRTICLLLKKTLEAAIISDFTSRSVIDIYVEVQNADGGVFSAVINAASLAIINSGIPMKDVLCCGSAVMIKGICCVDPNKIEETLNPQVSLVMCPKLDKIVAIESFNNMHFENYTKLLDAASEACQALLSVFDNYIKQASAKHFAEKMAIK